MARPPSDNPASESCRFRCTRDDKAEILKRAAAAGMSISEYLLRCALPDKKPRTD